MLITELKSKDIITSFCLGKTVIISCSGCKEVFFPEIEVNNLCDELSYKKDIINIINTDYICNPENLSRTVKISDANSILVFSCGIGIQTVSDMFSTIRVFPGCDTFPLPGFQGVTPLEFDCVGCESCHLNDTYGICPITSCSKSLINGQCGGCKNGMCEADSNTKCAWERIYKKTHSFIGVRYEDN